MLLREGLVLIEARRVALAAALHRLLRVCRPNRARLILGAQDAIGHVARAEDRYRTLDDGDVHAFELLRKGAAVTAMKVREDRQRRAAALPHDRALVRQLRQIDLLRRRRLDFTARPARSQTGCVAAGTASCRLGGPANEHVGVQVEETGRG